VNERPAIVEAAVLDDVVVLADTEYFTVPLPAPLLPEVIDTQDAALLAAHAHPLCVFTLMLPVPPMALMDAPVEEME
jgi:hypothetical protein